MSTETKPLPSIAELIALLIDACPRSDHEGRVCKEGRQAKLCKFCAAADALEKGNRRAPAEAETEDTIRLASDDDVEAVERLVGMGSGAWDMVSPNQLLEAVQTHFLQLRMAARRSGAPAPKEG